MQEMADDLKNMDMDALEAATLAGNRGAFQEAVMRAEMRGKERGEAKARYAIFMQERMDFAHTLPRSCGCNSVHQRM